MTTEHKYAPLPCPHHRSTKVSWLFDQSGGRGAAPSWWPKQHPTARCGYAGGINPGNVLASIDANDFWIDIESGVRDEHDRFDIDRCERVCELVYGARSVIAAHEAKR